MPVKLFMAAAQCMFPSPIKVKCVSTPSAAKAWASASWTGKLFCDHRPLAGNSPVGRKVSTRAINR
jgi:hypothetical protein